MRRAYDVVRLLGELTARRLGSDRHRDNDLGRIGRPHRANRCEHAGAGGDPVIDEDHRVTRMSTGSPSAAIGGLAAMKFRGFAVYRNPQLFVADAEIAHQVVVDDNAASGREGTHREFLPLRHTELAHQEHVERRVQERGDLPPDGHAAARKAEHQ